MENNNIQRSLGRIEGKIDGINEHLKRLNGSIESHSSKIDKVENCIAKIKAEATMSARVAGAVWGVIVTVVGLLISWFKK